MNWRFKDRLSGLLAFVPAGVSFIVAHQMGQKCLCDASSITGRAVPFFLAIGVAFFVVAVVQLVTGSGRISIFLGLLFAVSSVVFGMDVVTQAIDADERHRRPVPSARLLEFGTPILGALILARCAFKMSGRTADGAGVAPN